MSTITILNGLLAQVLMRARPSATGDGSFAPFHAIEVAGAELTTGNPLPVVAAALPLPAGAATAAGQPAINVDGGASSHITNFPATQTIAGSVVITGTTSVADSGTGATGVTIPAGATGVSGWLSGIYSKLSSSLAITASALPLPAGAATAAGQPAVNGDGGGLAHITNFPSTQAVSDTGTGATGVTLPTGATGVSGWLSGIYSRLGSALAITAAALPLPAGAATAANQPTLNGDGGAPSHVTNFPTTQTVAGSVSISGTAAVADNNSAAFQGEVAMTVGTSYTAGRSLKITCTVAGNVSVTYANGSTGVWPVVVGTQTLPIAVTQINSGGTTATATYSNLV